MASRVACTENKEHASGESSQRAHKCRNGLFAFEIFVILVVVMSQVFQLFVRPSMALLAIGTIPCSLLWKRPLKAFFLACISVTIYLVSRGIFFSIFAREVANGLLRDNKRKKPQRGTRHLYVPHSTFVDLVSEGLSDTNAEACAREGLNSKYTSMETNPRIDERVHSPQSDRTSHEQDMDARSHRESDTIFSRRGWCRTRNIYRIRGDAQCNVDIDREMEVADNIMEAMLSAFPDA